MINVEYIKKVFSLNQIQAIYYNKLNFALKNIINRVETMDLQQLSRKLLQNGYFMKQIKSSVDKYLQERKDKKVDDENRKNSLQKQSTKQNQKPQCQNIEQIQFKQNRYSIASSVFSKRQSRDSISSMTSNPFYQHMMQSQNPSANLNQVTTQITNLLTQLIKKQSLTNSKGNQHDSSSNISQIVQNMNSIHQQQLKSLKISLQQKISLIKGQFQEQVISIIQKLKQQRKNAKLNKKSTLLKQKRKQVTQSILNITKSNNRQASTLNHAKQISTFSNIDDIGGILSDSDYQQNQLQGNSSAQISQLSQKLNSVQKSQFRITKQFEQKFYKELQRNSKDINILTQKIIEWKLKNQQKIENGFSGVWNIVAQIQDRVNKASLRMEELEQAYALKDV